MRGTLLGRRVVLAGACVSCAAVAGCSDYGSGATPVPPEPAGTALVAASEVPVGGGVVLGDRDVVVTQPVAGTFRAFSATCTHQGCVVAEVVDGTINCTCHGSRYAVADGSVVAGPAPQPLPERAIAVDGDTITLA